MSCQPIEVILLTPSINGAGCQPITTLLISVPNWENLTRECGWSNKQYIRWMKTLAAQAFVKE